MRPTLARDLWLALVVLLVISSCAGPAAPSNRGSSDGQAGGSPAPSGAAPAQRKTLTIGVQDDTMASP
jgi:hypothetical protein